MSKAVTNSVSVGVVCTTSAADLARCLTSIRAQQLTPAFDVIVVHDPAIAIDSCRTEFPGVHFVANTGQRTPLQLVSRLLNECTGDLILLTKDHCVPAPDWIRRMVDAQTPDRAAVGGRVEPPGDASSVSWAFFFIDFYRYTAPIDDGWQTSLTVCNVSYLRERLATIREVWQDVFVETAVNNALAARFGRLWIESSSEVTLQRRLTLRHAVSERYRFGRLFGYSRLANTDFRTRLLYVLFTPALPFVLLGRLTSSAMRSQRHSRALMRAWLPLTLMVFARSVGEWIGYVTGRPPRTFNVH
jgi:hypothetical protein